MMVSHPSQPAVIPLPQVTYVMADMLLDPKLCVNELLWSMYILGGVTRPQVSATSGFAAGTPALFFGYSQTGSWLPAAFLWPVLPMVFPSFPSTAAPWPPSQVLHPFLRLASHPNIHQGSFLHLKHGDLSLVKVLLSPSLSAPGQLWGEIVPASLSSFSPLHIPQAWASWSLKGSPSPSPVQMLPIARAWALTGPRMASGWGWSKDPAGLVLSQWAALAVITHPSQRPRPGSGPPVEKLPWTC